MKVLVAYASRHGATRGIAERIAEVLGLEPEVARALAHELGEDGVGGEQVVSGLQALGHLVATGRGALRPPRSLPSTPTNKVPLQDRRSTASPQPPKPPNPTLLCVNSCEL